MASAQLTNSLSDGQPNSNHNIADDNQYLNNLPDKLDLADLDLSQLRLTKKDLETLSTLTPELPKQFQDQLLAQLPPEQARKLSRTLSMQSGIRPNISRVYKRSLSGGRDREITPVKETSNYNSERERERVNTSSLCEDGRAQVVSPLGFDRNASMRRSLSRSRNASGTSRIAEPNNRFSYSGDMKSSDQPSTSRYGFQDYSQSGSIRSSRPPPSGGCLSPPPPEVTDSPNRRRSLQRRISRFLRPDFFDTPSGSEDNYLLREKRERERETQSVLREIRERSRERSRDRGQREQSMDLSSVNTSTPSYSKTADYRIPSMIREKRKSSIPDIRTTIPDSDGFQKNYHTRNKSVELFPENGELEPARQNDRRCNLSMTRETTPKLVNTVSERSVRDITDSILDDLVVQSQKESQVTNGESSDVILPPKSESAPKKVKIKPKDGKETKPKKLKAIATAVVVEPPIITANINNIEMVTQLTNEIDSVTLPLPLQAVNKNTSKLIRPKSYPSKEIANEKSDKKAFPEKREKSVSIEREVVSEVAKKAPIVKVVVPDISVTADISIVTPKNTIKTSGMSTLASTKNSITGVVEKLIEKGAERLSPSKGMLSSKAKSDNSTDGATPKVVKKKVKIVKKKTVDVLKPTEATESPTKTSEIEVKEKSPEKKPNRGFLYSIGQKFEKMRESTKSKEKKSTKVSDAAVAAPENVELPAIINPEIERQASPVTIVMKKEAANGVQATCNGLVASSSVAVSSEQRKTKIDAMIRNLRERSLTHTAAAEVREGSAPPTESGLIKRAVSVEDLSNGMTSFNKCNVTKVLGLFKRIEKEQNHQKVRDHLENVRSSSAITVLGNDGKERPRSSGFVSKLKKGRPYYTGAKSDTIVTLTDKFDKQMLAEKVNEQLAQTNTKIPQPKAVNGNLVKVNCPECCQVRSDKTADLDGEAFLNAIPDVRRTSPIDQTTLSDSATLRLSSSSAPPSERERIKNNRKGLVLDLSNANFDNISFENKINNNSNAGNKINNNSSKYPFEQQPHGNNNGEGCCAYDDRGFQSSKLTSPSYDMSTNYSSDSKSLHDDGASSSTFLSPTDEPDMYDDWSVYSGLSNDNSQMSPISSQHANYHSPRSSYYCSYQPHTSSSSSKLSTGETDPSNSNPSDSESVIDRIKRRSFYCRFNEKKPKRASTIVGSAAREYYRDMATKVKPRAVEHQAVIPERADSCSRSKSATPINSKDMDLGSSYSHSTYLNSIGNNHSQLPTYHHRHYHSSPVTQSSSRTRCENGHDDEQSNDYKGARSSHKVNDYLSLRSTLTSPSSKGYSHATTSLSTDYLLNSDRSAGRSSLYENNGTSATPFLYASYNPKRRTSSYITPTTSTSSLTGNGTHHSAAMPDHSTSRSSFATLNHPRKPRAYDHRSISLLDSSVLTPCSLSADRRATPHHSHHLRSVNDYGTLNFRSSLRNPSITRTTTKNI